MGATSLVIKSGSSQEEQEIDFSGRRKHRGNLFGADGVPFPRNEESRTSMPTSRLILNGNLSASNRIARQKNRKRILNQIRVKQPISRAELARTSGLQRSTVSLIVEELLTDRWVVEGSTGEIPRGRKPTFLNLNGQRGVLALDIHPAHAMLAVTDLGGNIVYLDSVKL